MISIHIQNIVLRERQKKKKSDKIQTGGVPFVGSVVNEPD